MHCKKCLHYDVCVKLGKPSLYGINQEIGCSAYKDKTKWEEKKEPENNADRIRAMSDEELAKLIAENAYTGACNDFGIPHQGQCCHNCERCDAIIKWLKHPAE